LLNNRNAFWLGVAVSLVLLALLVSRVNFGELATALRSANYVYAAPAIALYFGAVYFRALRWRYLLSPLGSFRVARLYPVVIIGYTANNLLPARLGELVRSYYLAQREECSGGAALGTVAVERVYDGITLLALAALAFPLLLAADAFTPGGIGASAWWLAGIVAVVFLGALVFLTLAASPRLKGAIEWMLALLPSRVRPKVAGFVGRFVQGLLVLNSPRKHLAVFCLSAPVWLAEGAMYLLVCYSFGIQAYFSSFGVLLLAVILLTATSNLATALPSSIGGIGPFEVVAQQTLAALGVGLGPATAYAGFLHLVALWLPVNLAGLALLWRHNISLRRLVRSAAPPTAAARPGQPPVLQEKAP